MTKKVIKKIYIKSLEFRNVYYKYAKQEMKLKIINLTFFTALPFHYKNTLGIPQINDHMIKNHILTTK